MNTFPADPQCPPRSADVPSPEGGFIDARDLVAHVPRGASLNVPAGADWRESQRNKIASLTAALDFERQAHRAWEQFRDSAQPMRAAFATAVRDLLAGRFAEASPPRGFAPNGEG